MSRETIDWLNRYTLIGYTDKRGNAWHYRESSQGAEPNHYPGGIPVEDVERRLFDFEVIESPACYMVAGRIDGAITTLSIQDEWYSVMPSTEGRKGMLTSDTFEDIGSFKSGYQGHQYREWLLDAIAILLSSNGHELGIGSAGLLRKRAQAWVSCEMPENITTPEGVVFRPNLMSTTSFDGSIATTFKRIITDVVCDNTREQAMKEKGQQYKIKHTKYSTLKLHDAREALAIVFEMADDFKAEVAELTSWKVTDHQFEMLLNNIVPMPEEKGRAMTIATNKRSEIITLYRHDERAAPWKGTAWGVLQAFNTWNHHYMSVKGTTPRVVRNMENVLTGKFAQADNHVLAALTAVG